MVSGHFLKLDFAFISICWFVPRLYPACYLRPLINFYYLCLHKHTQRYICHMYIHIHVYTQTHTDICHSYTCIHVCIHTDICHTYTHIQVCIYTQTHTEVYVTHTHIYMYIYTYTLRDICHTYTRMYIYTYTILPLRSSMLLFLNIHLFLFYKTYYYLINYSFIFLKILNCSF